MSLNKRPYQQCSHCVMAAELCNQGFSAFATTYAMFAAARSANPVRVNMDLGVKLFGRRTSAWSTSCPACDSEHDSDLASRLHRAGQGRAGAGQLPGARLSASGRQCATPGGVRERLSILHWQNQPTVKNHIGVQYALNEFYKKIELE